MYNVLSFRCSDGTLQSHAGGYDVVTKTSEGKTLVILKIRHLILIFLPPPIDFNYFLSIFGS